MDLFNNLHPLIIHFPIVLYLCYAILESVNIFLKNNFISQNSFLLLIVTILFSIIAVLTGNLSFQEHADNFNITQYHLYFIEQHEYFATITLWYFIAIAIFHFYIRFKSKNPEILRYIFIIFVLFGIYLIFRTAQIGGGLVYDHGIGTNLLK